MLGASLMEIRHINAVNGTVGAVSASDAETIGLTA
jgi:hypothetical protein